MTTSDINPRIGTDDSSRLRELIWLGMRLHTRDAIKLRDAAEDMVIRCKQIGKELGLDLKNPPIPTVCKTTGGNCNCGGRC